MFKFIKKFFSLMFIVVFIMIFSYYNKDEFIDHYKLINLKNNDIINIQEKLSSFDLDNIDNIENLEFYYTPNKKLLDNIILKINNSEKRIFLEVYMLTEKRIKFALIKAKKRGVDVKVVLEKNPYMATSINVKHAKELIAWWVDLKWSEPTSFSLNHAKFIIFDNEVLISTWNFTYSSFLFNRDIFLIFSDKKLIKIFLEIFSSDFKWVKSSIYHDNLVLSPLYSRAKFEKLFWYAEEEILMYFPYLNDSKLKTILIEKAKKIDIKIVVSKEYYENNDNKEDINKLKKVWIKIKVLKKPKMHSKAILVDKKILFIWSINFSSYSLDKNRETGLIFKNEVIISKFMELFNKDFK